MLRVQEEKVLLVDTKSKFGTLIMANEFHPCETSQKLTLQVGRTVFEVTTEEHKHKGTCCTSPETDDTQMFVDMDHVYTRKDLDTNAKVLFVPAQKKKNPIRYQSNS